MGSVLVKKVLLIAVGKCESYFAEAVNEYVRRAGRYADLRIVELKESRTENPDEEAAAILRAVKGYTILFDLGGEQISSEELAEKLDRAYLQHDTVSFVIGSSRGVASSVRQAAHARIAFGRATFPHQLFRVMAAEQIYRAFCIRNGSPYHK